MPEDDLEALFESVQKDMERRKWYRDNPYVADLIAILEPHPKGMHRKHVISALEQKRQEKGLPMPKKFDETVQSAFQGHAAQSAAFRGHLPDDDLFYFVGRKGSGVWAVYRERAFKWLAAKMNASN